MNFPDVLCPNVRFEFVVVVVVVVIVGGGDSVRL